MKAMQCAIDSYIDRCLEQLYGFHSNITYLGQPRSPKELGLSVNQTEVRSKAPSSHTRLSYETNLQLLGRHPARVEMLNLYF